MDKLNRIVSFAVMATVCAVGVGCGSDIVPADVSTTVEPLCVDRSHLAGTWLDDTLAEFPESLSDLGVFPDVTDLTTVTQCVLEYEPVWPLWSNGSRKLRQLYLPEGGIIDTAAPEAWQFPTGTVLVKSFLFPDDDGEWGPVETRILRRSSEGWDYAGYLWNEERTDATKRDLEIEDGDRYTVTRLGAEFDHGIPSGFQCSQCHEFTASSALGVRPSQLVGTEALTVLAGSGLLSAPVDAGLAVTHEDPLTERIMGMVTGNCVHCHNGNEDLFSPFDMRHTAFLDSVVDVPTETHQVLSLTRVVSGNPELSALYEVLQPDDDGEPIMPPAGVQRVDPDTIHLMAQWIASLGETPPASDPAHEFAFVPVDTGDDEVDRITDLVFLPGGTEFLVGEYYSGLVRHFELTTPGSARQLGSFELDVYADADCALTFAVDPDFEENRLFYVSHCISAEEAAVTRYTFDPESYETIDDSAFQIVYINEPEARVGWHNIFWIGFDSDDNLIVFIGEKTVAENSQDLGNLMGSVLRIQPTRDDGEVGYTPTEGNPFPETPEIYAYGLRAPWRGALDGQGRIWVGDVGQNEWEEVNLVDEPGLNFGWPEEEGPCPAGDDCDGFADPTFSWSRERREPYSEANPDSLVSDSARVVWIGAEYLPSETDPYEGVLDNHLFFGDICLGFVRAFDTTDPDFEDRHIAHLPGATGWGQAANGYIYAGTFGRCTNAGETSGIGLFRMVPNSLFD